MHGAAATLLQSVPVSETFQGNRTWDGVVHVFKLTGHPKATRAYAWSTLVEAGNKRGFRAVLDIPPIMSPVDAVRSVIAQESRAD